MSTPKQGEERILLLVCKSCKTIEELPFDTSAPYIQDGVTKFDQRNNPWLQEATYPHDQKGCLGMLADVDKFFWMSPKGRQSSVDGIKKQLLDGGGAEGLAAIQDDIYNIKSTFQDDAQTCFTLHNRPKGQCGDWMTDSRKLMPKTSGDRKAAGLGKFNSKTYLCHYCPVAVYNQTRLNQERGLYK